MITHKNLKIWKTLETDLSHLLKVYFVPCYFYLSISKGDLKNIKANQIAIQGNRNAAVNSGCLLGVGGGGGGYKNRRTLLPLFPKYPTVWFRLEDTC